MKIYGIKAKQVMAAPGSWAFVAEAEVGERDCENVYVTIQEYEGLDLTVSRKSVYEFMAEDGDTPVEEFLEEYSSMTESMQSAYFEVFRKLREIIKILG